MKNINKSTVAAAVLAAGVLTTAHRVRAQSFTAGDLVVDRIGTGGTGSTALTNAATQTYVDEYTTAPNQTAPVESITLTGLTDSGTATSEGFLTRSTDGTALIVPGYNTAVGTTGSVSATTTTGTTNAREVEVLGASGTITSTTTLGTAYSGNNIRGAASPDGTNLYTSGANGGIYNVTAGSSTAVNSAPTLVSNTIANTRAIDIFNVNGTNTTFFSTASGTPGIYQVGSNGTSSASGQSSAIVLTTAAISSPYGFSISPNGLVAYVADDGGTKNEATATAGISEYTRTSTSGTFTLAATFNTAAKDLVVSYGTTPGTGDTIYFTNAAGTLLESVTDDGTPADFSGAAATTLATAAANTVFRGLDFAPSAVTAVPEPATWLAGGLTALLFGWSQRRRVFAGLNALGS